MQRVLLVLAVLGVFALSAELVLGVLLPGLPPSSLYQQLESVDLLSFFLGGPGLGVLVCILGAAAASQRGAAGWMWLFLSFEALTLVLPLLAVPFVHTGRYSCEVCTAPYSEDQTAKTIGDVALAIAFLFPLVDFVTALLYVWRGGAQSKKA